MPCAEDDCSRAVAARVYDPRGEDREVCLAHARGLGQREGVVVEPLEDADAEWP